MDLNLQISEQKMLMTAGILVALVLLKLVLNRIIHKKVTDLKSRYVWRQTINYILVALGLILIIRVWLEWIQSILTLLSLIAAAITIVSKELILNFLAYGIIIWRGLFSVGDRIQIGQYTGDVTEIGPSYFSLSEIGNWVGAEEHTGRVVKMPNSTVLTQPVANYARGSSLIWNEIPIVLSADSDWKQAKQVLLNIGKEQSYEFKPGELEQIRQTSEEIIFTETEASVYVRIKDQQMTLTLRYLCKFHKRRSSEQIIWDRIMDEFHTNEAIKLLAKIEA